MGKTPPAPERRCQRLNAFRPEAIRKAFAYKVSLVWGLAATGKSEVLARIICKAFIDDPKERILGTASRHVAVNNMINRSASVWKEDFRETDDARIPFVRLYSESQVRAQYAVKDKALYSAWHIDQHRRRLAKSNRIDKFSKQRDEFITDGVIANPEDLKAYTCDWGWLNKEVTEKASFVFCTPALYSHLVLYWKENTKVGKTTIQVLRMWKPPTNIVDGAACSNPLELLLLPTSFDTIKRVVYGGDHKQLPPFLSVTVIHVWIDNS